MSVKRSFLAIALLAAVLQGGAAAGDQSATDKTDSCTICVGKGFVTCPRCNDSGLIETSCRACDGKATTLCPTCDPEGAKAKGTTELSKVEREKLEAVLKLLRAAKVDFKIGDAKVPKEKPARAGRVDCPNTYCHGGTMLWEGGKTNPCLVCNSTGTVKCPDCSAGYRMCDNCGGKRKLTVGCSDCRGSRQIPCPGCRVTVLIDTCPLCDGKPSGACQVCARKLHGTTVCRQCSGRGETTCAKCDGLERITCGRCAGSGKVRTKIKFVDTGGTGNGGIKTCESCEGLGYDKCVACRRGEVKCEGCGGLKVAKDPCNGKIPCACAFEHAGAGWELLGDLLLTSGNAPRALELYQHALTQCRRALNLPLPKAEERRRKAEADLSAKIERLRPRPPK